MTFTDLESRERERQEAELTDFMKALLAGKVTLLNADQRKKLQGIETTIDHVLDGSAAIEHLKFTIRNGTTFMWDRYPAAVAIGRTDTNELILTGGIFGPHGLRRTGIEPRENDFFPEMIRSVPGRTALLNNALSFRIVMQPGNAVKLTYGGAYPQTRVDVQITGADKALQIRNHLNAGVRTNIPRL